MRVLVYAARMSRLPVVAIIGKPNTGKSTLFNRMIGRNKAIVSATAGTTRDHVAERITGETADYLLVDTGGMGGGTADKDFEQDVHAQSLLALEHADIIVLTLSSREDLTKNDHTVIDVLRKKKRKHVPVVIAMTKCDDPGKTEEAIQNGLGLGIADHVVGVSATHGLGTEELQQLLETQLTELHFAREAPVPDAAPRVAIIGKPNAGKSSLINALMSQSQRETSPLLVSPVPGTTRDSTDTVIRAQEKDYVFIDTAGIKRHAKTDPDIEVQAYFRSISAVQHCDVAVLVVDLHEPISKQDKRIAGIAVDAGAGLIVLANKADLIKGEERKEALELLHSDLQFCKYATIIPCSTVTRENLLKIFPLIQVISENRKRRLATKDLRRFLEDATHGRPMRSLASVKHIVQADEVPPTFVLFTNNPLQIQPSQLRYLENALRQTFGFEGSPVRWVIRRQQKTEK